MAKIGVLSPEFAIFCFLLFHSWDRSMKVRKWSLIFGCALAAPVIIHAAGLWGLKDGTQRQTGIEDRLTEKLNEYGKQTAETAEGRRQASRPITRAEVREQGRVDRARDADAHKLIAESITGRNEEIHKATFLSEGYMNGPMYAVNFLAALLFTSILTWMHFSAKIDDIDEDGDGIADIKQGKVVNYQGQDYALNPQTGHADPDMAEFLKWKNDRSQPQQGVPAPWPASNHGGQFNSDGAIDIQPEPKPEPEPIQIGPWAKPNAKNGKPPNEQAP